MNRAWRYALRIMTPAPYAFPRRLPFCLAHSRMQVTSSISTVGRKPLKLALSQGCVEETLDDGFKLADRLLWEASSAGAEVLVLPELFLGGYTCDASKLRPVSVNGPEVSALQELARLHQVALVMGFAEKTEFAGTDGKVYNSAIAIDCDGNTLATYRKCHIWQNENDAFLPGQKLGETFVIGGWRMSMLICYDVEFPEACRVCAMNGAEIIVVPTANFEPLNHINEKVVRCRALENHIYVCYCNWGEFTSPLAGDVQFNGRSVVADPIGNHVLEWKPGEADSVRCVTLLQAPSTTPREQNVWKYTFGYMNDRRPELYKPENNKIVMP